MGNPQNSDTAGFVLAGGRSSRMGRDKALLRFAGESLIARSLRILREAGLSASIAGAASDLSAFAPVIADAQPNLGPLAGICAALKSTSASHSVFLSVDTPFVPFSLLVYLLHRARITDCVVTVPSVNGFVQTFPSVIHRSALPSLQAELSTGRNGCFSAFQAAATILGQAPHAVSTELLAQSGHATHPHNLPPLRWFLNLNTQADVARAEALAARRIA